ncbi:hypothetical membrane protein [Halalkalibacter wakoensis JCM 9140]|uniref:Hypothetical membrane protein n=1 Tax=Halalkalibacter wakoensis JCM 9140 TaxID=1236970 RepID=W4Q3L4_9BACI|nr:DMT family transporter [Halalkalibacter wakoensis]GAE25939.1 hypothetical membrane protein [Halalkalibacter wakoensis JCM 9140]
MKKRFNPQRKYPPFLGVFFAISATLFLSIKPIIIKVIYEHGVTPEDALYIRQVIAAVVLSLLFLCSPKNRLLVKSRKMGIYLLLIGFFGFFLSPLLDFWGLVYVSAVLERMLLFTYPVFVILITALLNKWKIRVWTCVFFFIIYIGLFFALSGGNLSILKMNMFGGTLILLSAFTYAIYLVLASKVLTKTGVINVNAIGMVVSVLFLSIYLGAMC